MNQIINVFYGLGLWTVKETICGAGRKLFQFIYYISFVTSLAVGAVLSNDLDEFVFLAAIAILTTVHIFRLFSIIWKKDDILKLIHQTGTHSTNENDEFVQVNQRLNKFVKFVTYFVSICIVEAGLVLISPIFSTEKTLINIAFPLKNSRTAFWMTHTHIVIGCTYSVLCFLLSIIVCYLLMNCAIEYEILGNRLKNMGVIGKRKDRTTQKLEVGDEQQLFLKDLTAAIESYKKMNE